MFQQIRIIAFSVFNPPWAAGSDVGQLFPTGDFADELISFFHDCQIGGELGGKDSIKPQPSQSSDQFTGNNGTRLKAELLPKAHLDRWGSLYNDKLLWIVQSRPYPIDFTDFRDGTHRAGRSTLAAFGTVDFTVRQIKGGGDNGVKTTLYKIQSIDSLNLGANPDTAAAEDAFVGIPSQGIALLNYRPLAFLPGKPIDCAAVNAQVCCQILQLAAAAPEAAETVVGVIGEEKFDIEFPSLTDSSTARTDLHTFSSRGHACGQQSMCCKIFHNAYPAGTGQRHVWMIAQGRYGYAGFPGRFQESGPTFHLNHLIIYSESNHHQPSFLSKPY